MANMKKITARRDVLEPASPFRPFPLEEYELRWARTYEHMKALGYDTAVVWGKTSGVYERGHHILDPRTGLPARGLSSASVTGPELALADALATGLFASGGLGLGSIVALEAYDALVLQDDGTVVATPGFKSAPRSLVLR